jgi:hypothetical protein
MTKYKVRITDNNGFHKEFPDGTEIGGSYGEPKKLTLWLDDLEYAHLYREINYEKRDPAMAIMGFLASIKTSDWHIRQIRKHFPVLVNPSITL